MTSEPSSSSWPAILWRSEAVVGDELEVEVGIRMQALHSQEVAWRTSRRRRRKLK